MLDDQLLVQVVLKEQTKYQWNCVELFLVEEEEEEPQMSHYSNNNNE